MTSHSGDCFAQSASNDLVTKQSPGELAPQKMWSIILSIDEIMNKRRPGPIYEIVYPSHMIRIVRGLKLVMGTPHRFSNNELVFWKS
jgi:hypothetical protein